MTTYENGAIETPDWTPDAPKCCPFPACGVCGDPVTIPANVELGDN